MNEGFAPLRESGSSRRLPWWLGYGAIAVLGVFSLGLYLLILRPMTLQVMELASALEGSQQQIASTGYEHPEDPGAYLEDVQSKLDEMRELAAFLSAQTTVSSGLERLLSAPFRVLEFEQRRFDVKESLRQLAEAGASTLPGDFFSGLPSYGMSDEPQELRWLHLEFFNHVMEALLSSGRNLQVEQAVSLPVRTLGEHSEVEGSLLQVGLRLRVSGPAAALAAFLNASLPGSMNAQNPIGKKAYSIDRLEMRRVTDGENGQVTLDVWLRGFILNKEAF